MNFFKKVVRCPICGNTGLHSRDEINEQQANYNAASSYAHSRQFGFGDLWRQNYNDGIKYARGKRYICCGCNHKFPENVSDYYKKLSNNVGEERAIAEYKSQFLL